MNRRTFIARLGASFGVTVGLVTSACTPRDSLNRFFEDDFSRTEPGWGEPWSNVRYKGEWSTSGEEGIIVIPPAPRWYTRPDRPQMEYLGRPVVIEDRVVADVHVEALVAIHGLAEIGIVSRYWFDEAYALLLSPSEALLCKYGRMDRIIFARSRLQGAGKNWRLEMTVRKDEIEARVRDSTEEHLLKARDDDPLPAGHVGVAVNATDAERPGRGHFGHFAASSWRDPVPPKPRFVYRFAGGIVPSGTAFRARVTTLTDVRRDVSFQISEDPGLGDARSVGPFSPEGDLGSVHAWIDDLLPDRRYHWRPVADDVEGPIGSFSTPPPPGSAVRFIFGSCTSGKIDHYPSFQRAAGFRPHFYLHAGDWGYADQNAAELGPDHFQSRWIRLLRADGVTSLIEQCPLLFWQDDHDYQADNGWEGTVPAYTVGAFDELHANPANDYFELRWGDLHIFCLDCRLHASNPADPDGPGKSRLGQDQKSWLISSVTNSDAPVRVIASPMVFRNKDPRDSGWHNAYRYERDELLSLFASLDATILILSGDAHSQRLIHHFEFGDLYEVTSSGTDMVESDGWRQGSFDPEHTVMEVLDQTGFALVDLDAGGRGRQLKVRSVATNDGTILFEKSFAVKHP
jgi:hypothetical protein